MIAQIRYPKTTAVLVALLAVVASPFYAPESSLNAYLTVRGRVLYSNGDYRNLERVEVAALARMTEGMRACSHREFMYGWADLSQVQVRLRDARWPGRKAANRSLRDRPGAKARALFDEYEARCLPGQWEPIS